MLRDAEAMVDSELKGNPIKSSKQPCWFTVERPEDTVQGWNDADAEKPSREGEDPWRRPFRNDRDVGTIDCEVGEKAEAAPELVGPVSPSPAPVAGEPRPIRDVNPLFRVVGDPVVRGHDPRFDPAVIDEIEKLPAVGNCKIGTVFLSPHPLLEGPCHISWTGGVIKF